MNANTETTPYLTFISQLKELAASNPEVLSNLLRNILSMREIGNKTHGDIAEVAITNFINTFMSEEFEAKHVGKANFRSKSKEEDIEIVELMSKSTFAVSLKVYGKGPLQLSTDKKSMMFQRLEMEQPLVKNHEKVKKILNSSSFENIKDLNVLAVIYDEKKMLAKLMTFDFNQATEAAHKIVKIEPGTMNRKHPVYHFLDADDQYLFEVRYGKADANALQRGLWTNTNRNTSSFFSVTQDWIKYTINDSLVELISSLFVLKENNHEELHTRAKESL